MSSDIRKHRRASSYVHACTHTCTVIQRACLPFPNLADHQRQCVHKQEEETSAHCLMGLISTVSFPPSFSQSEVPLLSPSVLLMLIRWQLVCFSWDVLLVSDYKVHDVEFPRPFSRFLFSRSPSKSFGIEGLWGQDSG